jgi:hypothetical protein
MGGVKGMRLTANLCKKSYSECQIDQEGGRRVDDWVADDAKNRTDVQCRGKTASQRQYVCLSNPLSLLLQHPNNCGNDQLSEQEA